MTDILERALYAAKARAYAERMRRDIGLIGRLTEQELFDRRKPTIPAPPQTSTHAPGVLRAPAFNQERWDDPRWFPTSMFIR